MINLAATCGFGLESLVRRELETLGVKETAIAGPGLVRFQGDVAAIARANLWLRTADRVVIDLGQEECADFDGLFEFVGRLEWHRWIGPMDAFEVNAHTIDSKLSSVPALQRTIKKAVAQSLMRAHSTTELPETGAKYSIHLALIRDQGRLAIDTTGQSLHRRGYKTRYARGTLKETLAAAVVMLSFWERDRPFLDPFCGSGTIPIEAGMIGCNIAPGRNRVFSAESWPQIGTDVWEHVRRDADAQQLDDLEVRIVGMDIDTSALRIARESAERMGVEDSVHFQPSNFDRAASKRKYGCVVTNPPWYKEAEKSYDSRRELAELLKRIPTVLRHFPTWSHFVLSDHPKFEELVGLPATRKRKLYNDRLQCFLYQYAGPKPTIPAKNPSVVGVHAVVGAAFGELTEKCYEQAELFSRRLIKRAKHLRRWPTKQGITCFRLYERDIPEIPLVVDRYEDCLHIAEYERPHDRDPALHASWLELMVETAAKTLEISPDRVFFKHRGRQKGDEQHRQVADQKHEIHVQEGGLKFIVNLSDYVDTGLFLDHRITRSMVRDEARGKRFLNLFAYTGAFSIYAADGPAASTVTVDWSNQYLNWARRNMELNGFVGEQHQYVRADVAGYVASLPEKPLFDLAVVDPPTFSNSKRTEGVWEVQSGYDQLLIDLLRRMDAGGVIYFSNNFRRFKFAPELIHATSIHEISNQTVPPDFRNRRIHRCWRITK